MHIIFTIALYEQSQVHHLDVKTIFLKGQVDKEAYMVPPRGYEVEKDSAGALYRLKKSISILKQASHVWYNKLREALESHGLGAAASVLCMFVKGADSEQRVVLVVYMDDTIITSKDFAALEAVKHDLASRSTFVDLGKLNLFLIMASEWNCETHCARLSYEAYVGRVLEGFDMSNAKPSKTTMEERFASLAPRGGEEYEVVRLAASKPAGYQEARY